MGKEKSMILPQMALASLDVMKVAEKPKSGSTALLQWLQESADHVPLTAEGSSSSEPEVGTPRKDDTKHRHRENHAEERLLKPKEVDGTSVKYVKKLHRRIRSLERDMRTVTEENSQLREQVRTLERSQNDAKRKVSQLSDQLVSSERQHKSMQQKLKLLSGKESQLRRTSAELKEQVRDLELENGQLANTVAALIAEVESLRQQVTKLVQGAIAENAMAEAETDADAAANGGAVDAPEGGQWWTEPERYVVDEALGFVDEGNEGYVFQPSQEGASAEMLPEEMVADFDMGDTVKRVLWSDGHIELVPLQYWPRRSTITVRSFPRKRRVRRLGVGSGKTSAATETTVTPLCGDIVIVGGDCPTRYTEALGHLAPNVCWHNGFEQREKLEQLLRRAACVVTIETKMSHWAMHRIKELAKANQFVWRHVKVKSLYTVKAAVMEAIEAMDIVASPS